MLLASVSAPAPSTVSAVHVATGASVSWMTTVQMAVLLALSASSTSAHSISCAPRTYSASVDVLVSSPSQPSVTLQVLFASVNVPAHSRVSAVQEAIGAISSTTEKLTVALSDSPDGSVTVRVSA